MCGLQPGESRVGLLQPRHIPLYPLCCLPPVRPQLIYVPPTIVAYSSVALRQYQVGTWMGGHSSVEGDAVVKNTVKYQKWRNGPSNINSWGKKKKSINHRYQLCCHILSKFTISNTPTFTENSKKCLFFQSHLFRKISHTQLFLKIDRSETGISKTKTSKGMCWSYFLV